MINPNQKYIDGTWYEEEYGQYCYREMYINKPEPEWAVESDQYNVDMVTMIYGLDKNINILDCGSGVGQIIRAWLNRGFRNIKGIEISKIATEHANINHIKHGSVADMSMFKDNEFDLVESVALLEHIDRSIEDQVIKEMLRVGRRQAHIIGMDAGSDPSHLNIKTIEEWGLLFAKHAKDVMIFRLNGLLLDLPVLLVFRMEDAPFPLRHAVQRSMGGK